MKTLAQWFDEYGESHQHATNKRIHYWCVPAIFFSVCGLLMSIPSSLLYNMLPSAHSIITNWAFFALVFVNLFYMRLSPVMGFRMFIFSIICLIGNYWISQMLPIFIFSITLFVVAWIGQFYGHKIEGKKPSFFKDLQFLLIGPAWVINNVFSNKNSQ